MSIMNTSFCYGISYRKNIQYHAQSIVLGLDCFVCRTCANTARHGYGHGIRVGYGSLNSDVTSSGNHARRYEEDDGEVRRGRKTSERQVQEYSIPAFNWFEEVDDGGKRRWGADTGKKRLCFFLSLNSEVAGVLPFHVEQAEGFGLDQGQGSKLCLIEQDGLLYHKPIFFFF